MRSAAGACNSPFLCALACIHDPPALSSCCPQGLYKIAGLKGQPVCFIFTDSDVKDEAFLEYINQLLMTGGAGWADAWGWG